MMSMKLKATDYQLLRYGNKVLASYYNERCSVRNILLWRILLTTESSIYITSNLEYVGRWRVLRDYTRNLRRSTSKLASPGQPWPVVALSIAGIAQTEICGRECSCVVILFRAVVFQVELVEICSTWKFDRVRLVAYYLFVLCFPYSYIQCIL